MEQKITLTKFYTLCRLLPPELNLAFLNLMRCFFKG